MSITDEISFGNEENEASLPAGREVWRRLFLSLIILLVAGLSFGIGRLTSQENGREPIKIEYDQSLSQMEEGSQKASAIQALGSATAVVASKTGSKYHFPHCPGAKQIKEVNKLTFSSPQEAERAGYTLASNCRPK
jgi:hypothetical protein